MSAQAYSPEDVLEVLKERNRDQYPYMTGPEVAEELGASRPTVNDRLDKLVDRGDVDRVTFGNVRVYRLANERVEVTAPETIADGGEMLNESESTQQLQKQAGVAALATVLCTFGTGVSVLLGSIIPGFVIGLLLMLAIASSAFCLWWLFRAWLQQRDVIQDLRNLVGDEENAVAT